MRRVMATDLWIEHVALRYDGEACLIWPFTRQDKRGYGQITRNKKHFLAHRVICELANGRPPTTKHLACHACGRGHDGCVAPKHLYWGTRKDNAEDVFAHGWVRKLTPTDVMTIRNSSRLPAQLASDFNVHRTTIWQIHTGRTWEFLQ